MAVGMEAAVEAPQTNRQQRLKTEARPCLKSTAVEAAAVVVVARIVAEGCTGVRVIVLPFLPPLLLC